MIRINLLPVRAAKKREAGKLQLGIAVIALLVAAGANHLWHKSEQNKLEAVREEVGKVQREIRRLEEIIGQVKDIEERKEQVNRKLAVLDELRAGKTGPVKMMDSLATLIPTAVWVERFVESGSALTIDGHAARHEDLAAFISALNESPYFEDIRLRQANLQSRGDRRSVRFTITGRVTYTA